MLFSENMIMLVDMSLYLLASNWSLVFLNRSFNSLYEYTSDDQLCYFINKTIKYSKSHLNWDFNWKLNVLPFSVSFHLVREKLNFRYTFTGVISQRIHWFYWIFISTALTNFSTERLNKRFHCLKCINAQIIKPKSRCILLLISLQKQSNFMSPVSIPNRQVIVCARTPQSH